jgi:hypothetical protein
VQSGVSQRGLTKVHTVQRGDAPNPKQRHYRAKAVGVVSRSINQVFAKLMRDLLMMKPAFVINTILFTGEVYCSSSDSTQTRSHYPSARTQLAVNGAVHCNRERVAGISYTHPAQSAARISFVRMPAGRSEPYGKRRDGRKHPGRQ